MQGLCFASWTGFQPVIRNRHQDGLQVPCNEYKKLANVVNCWQNRQTHLSQNAQMLSRQVRMADWCRRRYSAK